LSLLTLNFMVELYKITRALAPQVVGNKREDANNQESKCEILSGD
jgi:hypothetical protein